MISLISSVHEIPNYVTGIGRAYCIGGRDSVKREGERGVSKDVLPSCNDTRGHMETTNDRYPIKNAKTTFPI